MSVSITLVRHGRSEANEANLWQGQGDAALSPAGRQQAEALGRRLGGRSFDLVVSSDLERAHATARAVDPTAETDPAWREMDLGSWEGRSFEEVAARHPDLLGAIRNGEAVAFGETGETISDFEQRAWAALDLLAGRLEDGASAMVATHGGIIDAILGRYLGRVQGKRTYPIVTNTSLTVLQGEPGALRLKSFNDATHLGIDVGFLGRMREDGIPVVAFVRHGVTAANKEGRIQGQSCWGLDREGLMQAKRLAKWYPRPDRVVSSPLQRALETAISFGRPIEEAPEVMEMAFGEWEGTTSASLAGDDAAVRIYRHGEDLPRGGHGETFMQVVERMGSFLGAMAVEPDQRTVVVSHGAAIRALVAAVHERGNDINDNLAVPDNTSVTHVVLSPDGPVLADYALSPHLEVI
ncbi:MAG: histidine phosphatase family protein [Acidimicrobiia bacterium]